MLSTLILCIVICRRFGARHHAAKENPTMNTVGIGVLTLLLLCCSTSKSQTISDLLLSNVEQARTILRKGVESSDFKVRIQAITAAGMIGRNEILLTRLINFLQDKNLQVRIATIKTLADLKSPLSDAALLKVLESDKVPEVSFAAAKALAEVRNTAGLTALKEVYDRTRRTRSNALKKEKRNFTEEFHSVSSAMMFIASKGVGYVPVPGAGEGFSAISGLLKDPGMSDRAYVLTMLCQTKSEESVAMLRKALQDEDWSVRATAVQMIAHTAQAELRDALLALFEDKSEKVRFRAAGAYLHLLLMATSSSL
jgi:HEAT repeat protein